MRAAPGDQDPGGPDATWRRAHEETIRDALLWLKTVHRVPSSLYPTPGMKLSV